MENYDESVKDHILATLKKVTDPETGIDVVSMGLITDIAVGDEGKVSLKFRPSSPFCPLGFRLAFDIKEVVKRTTGVTRVDIEVVNFIHQDTLNKLLKDAEG